MPTKSHAPATHNRKLKDSLIMTSWRKLTNHAPKNHSRISHPVSKINANQIKMERQDYNMLSQMADGSAHYAKITISVEDYSAIDAVRGKKKMTVLESQSIYKDSMENMIKRSYH